MRRNTYFKASLVNKRDEEALFNTFSLYIIGIIQAIVIVILQRDFNLLSISMFGFRVKGKYQSGQMGCSIQDRSKS